MRQRWIIACELASIKQSIISTEYEDYLSKEIHDIKLSVDKFLMKVVKRANIYIDNRIDFLQLQSKLVC